MQCRVCKIELTDENWSIYRKKHYNNICKNCDHIECQIYNNNCKEERTKKHKVYNDKNRANILKYHLNKKYNISVDQYNQLLEDCKYSCEICGCKEDLCVDHDHKTQKIRGILCLKCNAGLGQFNDNSELLQKSIYYLKENNVPIPNTRPKV